LISALSLALNPLFKELFLVLSSFVNAFVAFFESLNPAGSLSRFPARDVLFINQPLDFNNAVNYFHPNDFSIYSGFYNDREQVL